MSRARPNVSRTSQHLLRTTTRSRWLTTCSCLERRTNASINRSTSNGESEAFERTFRDRGGRGTGQHHRRAHRTAKKGPRKIPAEPVHPAAVRAQEVVARPALACSPSHPRG